MCKGIFIYIIMMFMDIKCQHKLIVKIIIFVQKPHTDHRHRSIFVICVPAFRRMVVGEGAVLPRKKRQAGDRWWERILGD